MTVKMENSGKATGEKYRSTLSLNLA